MYFTAFVTFSVYEKCFICVLFFSSIDPYNDSERCGGTSFGAMHNMLQKFHCPFCVSSIFKPTRQDKLNAHIKNHFKKAVVHGGKNILSYCFELFVNSVTEDHALYPPHDLGLKQMVQYILQNKKIPAVLPDNIRAPSLGKEYPKYLCPEETMCQRCPGVVPLSDPILITKRAKILSNWCIVEGRMVLLICICAMQITLSSNVILVLNDRCINLLECFIGTKNGKTNSTTLTTTSSLT